MTSEDTFFRDALSESELSALTREELSLWLTRPKRSEISGAKKWMIVRVLLLTVALAYYLYKYGTDQEISPLFIVLFCYENAYYMLRKEKAEGDYGEALSRYFDRVKDIARGGSR